MKKKTKFTLKELFSIVDGRLSTEMDVVNNILIIVTNDEVIPPTGVSIVVDNIKRKQPKWYVEALQDLQPIKQLIGNNFEDLMKHLDTEKKTYTVTPLN